MIPSHLPHFMLVFRLTLTVRLQSPYPKFIIVHSHTSFPSSKKVVVCNLPSPNFADMGGQFNTRI